MRMGKPRRSAKPEKLTHKVDGNSENNASYKCCIGQSDTVVSGATYVLQTTVHTLDGRGLPLSGKL